jgi:hypothetical protein
MSVDIDWAIDIDCHCFTHDTGTVLYKRWCQEPKMQQGGETEEFSYICSIIIDGSSIRAEREHDVISEAVHKTAVLVLPKQSFSIDHRDTLHYVGTNSCILTVGTF